MAQQTTDNRIQITHFVNPHLFYFKWLRDDGKSFNLNLHLIFVEIIHIIPLFCEKLTVFFSDFCALKGYYEELDVIEKKVEAIAKERTEEAAKSGVPSPIKIRTSEVVAVWCGDWHKYIRATVKKKETDDLYCVFCIDYGLPMVVHISNIIKLPSAFMGMQLKHRRIHVGGIENCLPAEKRFDINMESSVKEKLPNWSPQAIELMQKILDQAVKLEFEHVHNLVLKKRPHFFGRLMMQRPVDGQMVNVMKCLLDMQMAVLAEGEFASELLTIETLNQSLNVSMQKESLLTFRTCVGPVRTVSNAYNDGYSNSEIYESDDENEPLIDEDGGDLPIEDNEFFDESVSMVRPQAKDDTSNANDALSSIWENDTDNHATRNDSNSSQSTSKMNKSIVKLDNDVENNNASQQVKHDEQRPKNKKKQNDRKQGNKDNVKASNKAQNQQQPRKQQQNQPQQQKAQQQQQPNQQNQQYNHQPQDYQENPNRRPMTFDQIAAPQRPYNADQKPNKFQFQQSNQMRPPFPHPAAHDHQHRSPQAFFHRPFLGVSPGCPEFEASFGKPPPNARFMPPFARPSFGGPGSAPFPYPYTFNGMYGLSSPQSRPSNLPPTFHDANGTNPLMAKQWKLNTQPPNHPNGVNQRAQNRLRNRNSGSQGRINQSTDNSGQKNTNGPTEQHEADQIKPIAQDNPITTKVNSVKSVKSESIGVD